MEVFAERNESGPMASALPLSVTRRSLTQPLWTLDQCLAASTAFSLYIRDTNQSNLTNAFSQEQLGSEPCRSRMERKCEISVARTKFSLPRLALRRTAAASSRQVRSLSDIAILAV